MAKRVRILAEETAGEPALPPDRTQAEVEEADGARRMLTHEIYHHGDAAAVLLYDAERGVVLLVRQFRLAAYLAEGALDDARSLRRHARRRRAARLRPARSLGRDRRAAAVRASRLRRLHQPRRADREDRPASSRPIAPPTGSARAAGSTSTNETRGRRSPLRARLEAMIGTRRDPRRQNDRAHLLRQGERRSLGIERDRAQSCGIASGWAGTSEAIGPGPAPSR